MTSMLSDTQLILIGFLTLLLLSLARTLDFAQDGFALGLPPIRLRLKVALGKIRLHVSDQLTHATETAVAHYFLSPEVLANSQPK